jgi:Fe-S-cluster containining protein
MPRAKPYTTDVCSECPGRCCSQKRLGFSYLTLTMKESGKKLFAPHIKWQRDSILKRDVPIMSLKPQCPFLGENNRCTIYSRRPEVCRGFICYTNSGLIERLKDYPTHRRLLNRWKVLPGQKYGIPVESES